MIQRTLHYKIDTMAKKHESEEYAKLVFNTRINLQVKLIKIQIIIPNNC